MNEPTWWPMILMLTFAAVVSFVSLPAFSRVRAIVAARLGSTAGEPALDPELLTELRESGFVDHARARGVELHDLVRRDWAVRIVLRYRAAPTLDTAFVLTTRPPTTDALVSIGAVAGKRVRVFVGSQTPDLRRSPPALVDALETLARDSDHASLYAGYLCAVLSQRPRATDELDARLRRLLEAGARAMGSAASVAGLLALHGPRDPGELPVGRQRDLGLAASAMADDDLNTIARYAEAAAR